MSCAIFFLIRVWSELTTQIAVKVAALKLLEGLAIQFAAEVLGQGGGK
jgi:hypothetical protein